MNTLKNLWSCRLAGAAPAAPLMALMAAPALAQAPVFHTNAADVIVPVVAMLSVFGAPAIAVVLIAYFVLRHRERRAQLLNERIQRFLEAGQPVPEDLMQDSTRKTTPEQHLQHGLLLLGFGVGLTIFLSLLMGAVMGSAGLVFIGLGIAKLVIWKVASRQG